jgi:hypothetical protein
MILSSTQIYITAREAMRDSLLAIGVELEYRSEIRTTAAVSGARHFTMEPLETEMIGTGWATLKFK